MLIRRPSDIRSSEITDERSYLRRRDFMRLAGSAAVAATAAPWLVGCGLDAAVAGEAGAPQTALTGFKPKVIATDEKWNTFEQITSYNNYYEFGTEQGRSGAQRRAAEDEPWTVKVDGLVDKPGDYGVEDLVDFKALEERVYRLRCVEAWSMVIPWIGVPLSQRAQQGAADSRRRSSSSSRRCSGPTEMPGQRPAGLEWPYVEGLRMDEAMHPLTLMVVGLYGKVLPNQNGAPLRVHVPWKYGFKSGKSIVRIRFTDKMPRDDVGRCSAPNEYGFYANVNPTVDHPRWSQAREKRLPTFFANTPTLMFNGYGDQVASLYTGMDLQKYLLMRPAGSGSTGSGVPASKRAGSNRPCSSCCAVAGGLSSCCATSTRARTSASTRSKTLLHRPGERRCALLLGDADHHADPPAHRLNRIQIVAGCSASGRSSTRSVTSLIYVVFDQPRRRASAIARRHPEAPVHLRRACSRFTILLLLALTSTNGMDAAAREELAAAAPAGLRRRIAGVDPLHLEVRSRTSASRSTGRPGWRCCSAFRVVLARSKASAQARGRAARRCNCLTHSGTSADIGPPVHRPSRPLQRPNLPVEDNSVVGPPGGPDHRVDYAVSRSKSLAFRRSYAQAGQVRREGPDVRRQGRLGRLRRAQQHQAERVVHAEVVREAAAEVVAEGEAAARLAARDRLALPGLRARGAPGDPRRQARLQGAAHREDRRDQGARSSSATARS